MCCRRLRLLAAVGATVFLLSGAIAGQQPPPQVWIGVSIKAENYVPSIEGTTAKSGLRVTSLSFDSPADKAGLLINDLIVGAEGHDFSAQLAAVEYQFRGLIMQHMPAMPFRFGLSAIAR